MSQHSFVAYIDESGDEGFVFHGPGKGSSRWFVISAVITRREQDLETVKLIDAVRSLLRMHPRDPLHFIRMKHERRLPYLQRIASAPLCTVTILVHKPSLQKQEEFRQKHRLYFYATRFLLERVSWFCRDQRSKSCMGDGSVTVVFSKRSSTSYSELDEYLSRLERAPQPEDVRIDWGVVKRGQVSALDHTQCMGLKIADAVASAFFLGVEEDRFGFTEPRYGQMLRPVVYSHAERQLRYGLKFWPTEAELMLGRSDPLRWVLQTYK